ncbi:hypothetical protein PFISCL1PPCAC_11348, partial [Pristionchus fissidentatus]
ISSPLAGRSLVPLIDRRMKMDVTSLLLLLMFIITAQSTDTSTTEPLCGKEMECLVPIACKTPSSTKTTLSILEENEKIVDSCGSILKMRAYTKKKILMVFKTLNENVKSITLTKDTTSIECSTDGSTVAAEYKENAQSELWLHLTVMTYIAELIRQQVSPLLCQFIVEDTVEIFADNNEAQLSTDEPATFEYQGLALRTEGTCDPENARALKTGDIGGTTVVNATGMFDILECPAGYKLRYGKDGAATLEKASKLECKKENRVFAYVPVESTSGTKEPIPGKFIAECSAPTCSLCGYIPTVISGEEPTIAQKGECKELTFRCPPESYLQVNSMIWASSNKWTAQCKYANDKHVWELEKTLIDKETNVSCITNKCRSLETQCVGVRSKCAVPINKKVPVCTGGGKLKINGVTGTIGSCDETIGDWTYNLRGEKEERVLSEKEELTCGTEDKIDSALQTGGMSGATTGLIAGGVIILCVIGAIVGVVCCMRARKKKQAAAVANTTAFNTPLPASAGTATAKSAKSTTKSDKQPRGDAAPSAAAAAEAAADKDKPVTWNWTSAGFPDPKAKTGGPEPAEEKGKPPLPFNWATDGYPNLKTETGGREETQTKGKEITGGNETTGATSDRHNAPPLPDRYTGGTTGGAVTDLDMETTGLKDVPSLPDRETTGGTTGGTTGNIGAQTTGARIP